MKLSVALAAMMAASLLAAPPAGAAAHAKPRAKVRTLTGQVMAAPYTSGRKVVVPVLIDRASLRRAKLRAPVGVLLLKQAKTVKVRGQRVRVAPALLRAGDRLRARAKVTGTVRRASYWRMPARSFKLTKRSATLAPVELQTLLVAFGGDIRRLDAALTAIAKYVQAGFQKLGGDVGALSGELQSLASALQSLEQRVVALEAGLPALEARMQAQFDALAQDFSSLQTQVAALQTQLVGLEGDMAALEGDMAALQGDVAAIQAGMAQLSADMANVQAAVGALCGSASPLDALC